MNPVATIRRERGLTASQLAMICACSSMTVQRVECGELQKVSKKIVEGLAKLGYDPEEIQEQYKAWKHEKAMKLVEGVSSME